MRCLILVVLLVEKITWDENARGEFSGTFILIISQLLEL